jgi:hypothetical protein
MAFPDDLGGIYTREEMEQAEGEKARITVDQPGPDDGITEPLGYRIGFGQWKSRSIEEIYNDPRLGPERIKAYIEYLEDNAKKKGVELLGPALEFVQHAEEFLGAMENSFSKD